MPLPIKKHKKASRMYKLFLLVVDGNKNVTCLRRYVLAH